MIQTVMAEFDIVLYGATGFTGQQAAHYLARRAPAGLRWAVAGRSAAKLEALAEATGAAGAVVADSTRPETIDAMVARARVVATTAGPFSRYGTPVVEACAEHAVDYVDITGETPWVRELIDRFHHRAAASGARLTPFCGFDSVPSDLGALLVVDHLRRAYGEATRRVSASFRLRGGLNGGTLATLLEKGESGGMRRAMEDPFLLNPPDRRGDEAARDRAGVEFDADRGVWLAPFFMAPINTRVVRRSAALAAQFGEPYGPNFGYDEALETSRRAMALAMSALSRATPRVAGSRLARAALRKLGPAPGQGPSERAMDHGFFTTRLVGESESGRKVMATLRRHGDPGNRVTVAILCESALLLALAPRERLPGGAARGGVLTPATALGLPLVDRLRDAEFELDVGPL
jgi:short subunit dehydrogenase-like uncharacterized protein